VSPVVVTWAGYSAAMIGLIVVALVLWVILGVVGFAVHALIWLAYAAIVLFVVTAIFGAVTHGRSRR
jgi:hypothetical protein